MKKVFLSFIIMLFFAPSFSQGTWQWTGRVHPELEWNTISTEHFNIHYHSEIEEIARKGAAISEQVYPTLLKQMNIESTPVIDVIFTSEDEIMNGYALWTNQTFIWVDQNDAAVWLEDEKWLFQVVSHELQHIIFFNAIDTWMPQPLGFLFSGAPGWLVEGLAEYYTERWRPYRADISHKYHVYKNKTSEMDPHHDGYSKLLMMGEKFGDSTIVNILQYRDKLGLWNFKKAFKKYTKMSVDQFNEEWRQVMNTYYYGLKAQKEAIDDVGTVDTLPINKAAGFLFTEDSLKIAMIGNDNDNFQDRSLIIATIDTTTSSGDKKSPLHIASLFRKKAGDESDSTKTKPKPRVKKEEVDFGNFHPAMSWSSDGKKLLYAKYHFGTNGSLIYDIRVFDTDKGKSNWITRDLRATYPIWSPDGKTILFVAHSNSTSNLFQLDPESGALENLTNYTGDVQILSPRWSPDGKFIAYAFAGEDGNCDIMLYEVQTGESRRLTKEPQVDYLPVWHPDSRKITFTSHRNTTPNLYTVDINTGHVIQNTDVSDAVWSVQWSPSDSTVLASTLNVADSVRIVRVDPEREITTSPLSIRDRYFTWRSRQPDHTLPDVDPNEPAQINSNRKYKFYRHVKHITSFVIPMESLMGVTAWTDALGKHVFQVIAGTTWDGSFPYFFVQYVNAQHGPLWGANYFYNTNWSFRFYDESHSGLFEKRDGFSFWASHPVNFGNNMSSNHTLSAMAQIYRRTTEDVLNDDDSLHEFTQLPTPQEGNEALVTLNYRWTNRRPDKRNIALPRQGYGINLSSQFASSKLFGDFTYERYTADAFINLDVKAGSVYLRTRAEALNGNAPAQDYVGFSNDISIYGSGNSGTFGMPENINPRGWDGILLGDRMIFGTAEFRMPLIPALPVNFFGIGIGNISGAIISDFGNVWYSGNDLPDWIATAGYEMKVGVKIGSFPVFFIGVGQAQPMEDWKDESKTPDTYVRFSLINPF